ncbi:MAG: hypothetical protein IKX31_09705 [Muribaculaceae bacterium]|nr:hypothetical protein [Muribaculaceae bacterium]
MKTHKTKKQETAFVIVSLRHCHSNRPISESGESSESSESSETGESGESGESQCQVSPTSATPLCLPCALFKKQLYLQ